MHMFESITSATFSMPVCIIGPLDEKQKQELKQRIQSLSMDFLEHHFDFFDVASALELTQNLSQQSEGQSCLFYSIHSTNKESQNTLLKSLEDYGGTTPVILQIPHTDIFLPTIISRCYVLDIRAQQTRDSKGPIDWKSWLQLPSTERMKILSDMKDDMTLSMLQQGIDILEKKFHNDFLSDRSVQKQLVHIQKIREWVISPNPSLTMIGEYMSLVL